MSDAEKAALSFAIFVSLIGGGVILWGLWHAVFGIYDHFTGKWKRLKNKRFDASVGRDAYRFVKGVHR